MRRENILKIRCNHHITDKMEFIPFVFSNNTLWTWITLSDFSDEEAKVEKLGIKFKLLDVVQNFKKFFTDSVNKVKNTKQNTFKQNNYFGDLSVKFAAHQSVMLFCV